jgi:ABC-type multidrug transport system permease subunit
MAYTIIASTRVFCYLIQRDLKNFLPNLVTKVINGYLWIFLTAFVAQHILTLEGMPKNYGLLIICANIMSWGMFEMRGQVNTLMADIKGFRTLDYFLTLPLSQWIIFVALACAASLRSIIVVVCIFPIAKILFWNELMLLSVAWGKFFAVFIVGNLMYGFAGLWLVSLAKDMGTISNIWMRIVFPLWLGGGYQFTWSMLKAASPVAAYISLLNPLVYAYEGVRGAVLGSEGYINFWYCVGALICFTLLSGYFGIKRLMKQLDCL